MPTAEMLRTFVALPLSAETHARLTQAQRAFMRTCPEGSVRWVKPEGIHLTLFFLGEIGPDRVAPIQTALAAVARAATPFAFQVQGSGCFPNLKRPRVFWVGIEEPNGRLAALQAAVSAALAQLGFQPEERDFSPHLTLGRVAKDASPADLRRIGEALAQAPVGRLGEEQAAEMVFFRSLLKPTGAEYTPLARFRLGEPG